MTTTSHIGGVAMPYMVLRFLLLAAAVSCAEKPVQPAAPRQDTEPDTRTRAGANSRPMTALSVTVKERSPGDSTMPRRRSSSVTTAVTV